MQIGEYLERLKDGLHGALYIGSADPSVQQDSYLLAASGQSIEGIVPCTSSGHILVYYVMTCL